MHFERLYVFTRTPSLLDLIGELWSDGEFGLAVLIALFSAVFPFSKLAILLGTEMGAFSLRGRLGRVLPHLSKWSMVDVMLVAIAIFAAKSSGLASIAVLPGLWFYAASAIGVGLLFPSAIARGAVSAQNLPAGDPREKAE
ncbi:paraquat-inducible protein A [Rhizobium helianthi]|uniref:Paraquat-inducible protein A n=1 Tax=Rhizobium helianthi TaxID=1132695 RepID=A0ABW4M2U9_9HYPH